MYGRIPIIAESRQMRGEIRPFGSLRDGDDQIGFSERLNDIQRRQVENRNLLRCGGQRDLALRMGQADLLRGCLSHAQAEGKTGSKWQSGNDGTVSHVCSLY